MNKLEELLNQIGYKVSRRRNNYSFIQDQNGNYTGYSIFGSEGYEKLERNNESGTGGLTFYLKHCDISFVDENNDCVSVTQIGNEHCFILFSNFDLKRA